MVDDDFYRRQDERIAKDIKAAKVRKIFAQKARKEHERARVYGNRERHKEKIARMRKVTLTMPVSVVKSEGSWTRLTALANNGQVIWLHVPTEWIVGDSSTIPCTTCLKPTPHVPGAGGNCPEHDGRKERE